MRTIGTTPTSRLFVPWILLSAVCSAVMWVVPGDETVPYHLAWIGLAVAYGIEAWPWARTVFAVIAYTVVTGVILVERAATGVIGWGEIAEIPLMSVLVLLVLWNVRTRHLAYRELARIAERDGLRAKQRERLSRMTSHEMRTPATIALGYADMLLKNSRDQGLRRDLLVICDELHRLVVVSDRVVRTIRMHDHDDMRVQNLPRLLGEMGERWSVVADRHWVIECEPIRYRCSAGRLRASLDTLVENALRYTEDGDTVRIFCRVVGSKLLVGVADSGPGIHPDLLRTLNGGGFADDATGSESYLTADPKAQSGLGLALVREAAEARAGCLVAGVSAEGGALIVMALPSTPARPGQARQPGPATLVLRRGDSVVQDA